MGYWRSKVVPTMKKLFERSPTKKANLVESSKDLTFDDSKEIINKEIEEKKTELEPKVVEIYQTTSAELKALVKEPTEDGLKKLSAEVNSFLEALVKIEFPGSKAASETPSSLGPVTFIFEKVCVFLPAEAKPREVVAVVEEAVKTDEPVKVEETKPEKEIEIVEETKEEVKPAPVPLLAAVEEKKPVVEEKKPVVEEKAVPLEEKKAAVEEKKAAVEEKKPAVEEKKPAVEEKKHVEEVKKEVAAVPVVEITTTKAPETPVVETPAKAPAPSVAEPKKA